MLFWPISIWYKVYLLSNRGYSVMTRFHNPDPSCSMCQKIGLTTITKPMCSTYLVISGVEKLYENWVAKTEGLKTLPRGGGLWCLNGHFITWASYVAPCKNNCNDFAKVGLLCISTIFWVLGPPESWSKYFKKNKKG